MSWIIWILVGLVAGAIAKFVMPGPDPGGIIVTIIIGILGAIVGGWLGGALGLAAQSSGFNIPTLLTAIGGSLVLLFLYRLVTGRGSTTRRT